MGPGRECCGGGCSGGGSADPEAAATLHGASLVFTHTPRDGDSAVRYVEPHRLVSLGRRWYLAAWDLDRGDWRSFRVDRLSAPGLTRARFRPREIPGGDPVAWLRSRIAAIPTKYDVAIVFQVPASRVISFVGQWAT